MEVEVEFEGEQIGLFLPAGCSAQPFTGVVQPAQTNYAGGKTASFVPLCRDQKTSFLRKKRGKKVCY